MHLHELVFQPSDWDFGYLSPICSFMYGLLLEDPFLSFPGILYSIDFFSFYFLIALVWRKTNVCGRCLALANLGSPRYI